MKQTDRIKTFVSQLFEQSALNDKQTAIVFGKTETPEEETFQNEYKCQNFAQTGCLTNFKKCANAQAGCHSSRNANECKNELIK